jgi:hypothetical protein
MTDRRWAMGDGRWAMTDRRTVSEAVGDTTSLEQEMTSSSSAVQRSYVGSAALRGKHRGRTVNYRATRHEDDGEGPALASSVGKSAGSRAIEPVGSSADTGYQNPQPAARVGLSWRPLSDPPVPAFDRSAARSGATGDRPIIPATWQSGATTLSATNARGCTPKRCGPHFDGADRTMARSLGLRWSLS